VLRQVEVALFSDELERMWKERAVVYFKEG
jgi:hypothetical protein